MAADLLVRGVDRAATAIYFISKFTKPDESLSWTTFSREHIDRLVSKLSDEKENSWSLRALKCICAARPDLVEAVSAHALSTFGVARAALFYCASSVDPTPVFEALAELAEMGVGHHGLQCTHLLKQIELNWAGHEALFVRLLRLRERRLALALLDEVYMERTLGECAIGPIDWWLEWLSEEGSTESGYWFCYRMAYVFGRVLSAGDRQAFVAEFNRAASPFRSLLAHGILPHFPDLTTDVFGADAISFLLAELNREGSVDDWRGHLLGTATEQFVNERLLPLVAEAKPPLSDNLRRVLRQAGSRHGRRYARN